MAGIPFDGVLPRPPEDEGPDIPRQQSHGVGGKIGGIFSTLLGIKHAREVAEKENYGNWALGILHKAATEGGVSKEQQNAAYKLIRGAFGDTAADIIQFHTKQANERIEMERAKAEEDRLKRALLDQGQQKPAYQGTFTPPMPAAAMAPASPAAPAPTPQPQPATAAQTAPATVPDQGGPGGPSATDSAVPYFLRPNAPAPGAAPPAPGSGVINTLMERRLPAPPFNSGVGMAGPAPMPPNPVIGRVSSAASGGVGFGGSTTTPYIDSEMQPEVNPLADFRQIGVNKAAMNAPLERFKTDENIRQSTTIAQQALQQRIQESERILAEMEQDPGFQKLPELQKQEMRLRVRGVQGAISNLARPMNLPTSDLRVEDLPEGALDVTGKPIDRTPGKWVRQQQDPASGELRYYYVEPKPTQQVEPDKDASTGWSYVKRDRKGAEVSRSTAPPPGSQVIRETDTDIFVQVGNDVKRFNKHTRIGPGRTDNAPANGKLPAPPGDSVSGDTVLSGPETKVLLGPVQAGAGASTPAQGVSVGKTPAAQRREEELDEYSEHGKVAMEELTSRMQLMERLMEQLKPYQKSKVPMSSLLDVIAYKLGYDKGWGEFISQLNLSGMQQAASLMRGMGKGKQLLDEMHYHVANANKDSGELMWNKMKGIYKNMQDMRNNVNIYGRKRVKVGAGAGGGMPTPPPKDAAEYLKSIGQ